MNASDVHLQWVRCTQNGGKLKIVCKQQRDWFNKCITTSTEDTEVKDRTGYGWVTTEMPEYSVGSVPPLYAGSQSSPMDIKGPLLKKKKKKKKQSRCE